MSSKISARNVLIYLNELGYTNVDAQHLKEFIKDLKKIIKYYDYQKENQNTDETDLKIQSKRLDEIFANLHARGTCESKAKEVHVGEKGGKVITVQIKRQNKAAQNHASSGIDSKDKIDQENQSSRNSDHLIKAKQVEKILLEKNVQTDSNENIPSEKTSQAASKATKTKSSKLLKPTKSFIRPVFQSSLKSDPVSLYQQYQADWKRFTIPGEDNRADLRWAIREKMMSGSTSTRL